MTDPGLKPGSAPPADVETDDAVDLELLAAIVRRRARLAVAVFLVVMVVGALGTFLRRPVYQAQATLLIKGKSGSGLSLSPLLEAAAARLDIYAGPSEQGTALQLLKSLDLIEKAARELGLKIPLRELRERVNPEIIPESELIALKVADGDPQRAVALADKITQLYVQDSGRFAQESSARATQHLRESIAKVRVDLSQAEEAVVAYATAHGLSTREIDAARLTTTASTLSQELITARLEHDSAARSADYYRQRLARETEKVISATTVQRNPVVAQAEGELARLELQRAGLAATHGPEHVAVKELDRSIAQARAQINQAVATVITSQVEGRNPAADQLATQLAVAEAQARAAQAREKALDQMSARLQRRLESMPRQQVELERLQRRAALDAQLYGDLMRQYQMTAASAQASEPTALIVAPARLPTDPIRPRPVIDLMLTGILAVLLAVMIGAIAEMLDSRLHTAEDIHTVLRLPVLAQLPFTPGLPRLLEGEALASAWADQLRLLRRDLCQAGRTPRLRSVLVAGADPGDGRTTVALNLGVITAHSGARAVVIDADLRGDGLAEALPDLGKRPGLSAVLAGEAKAAEALQPTAIPGLQVVGAGRPAGSPAALLDAPLAAPAWAAWTDAADLVLVDSPPLAAYADALLLASLCDTVLLVVRSGRTTRRAARRTVERLQATGATVAGVVINAV
jgi:capsular exopolysaccharide synthesis family protein